MAAGISIHIGLNSVDPHHYGGWSGPLNACEADAEDMAALCKGTFDSNTLLTKKATRDAVLGALEAAVKTLKAGDDLILSMVDDELFTVWTTFAKGVKIAVFSDSCHSGSVVKVAYYRGLAAASARNETHPRVAFRNMPPEVELRTYRQNREFYDKVLTNPALKTKKTGTVEASVLLISGCMDNQLSADGAFNGLFTGNLLRVWNHGAFEGGYRVFHQRILTLMPPDQTPNFFKVGAANPPFEQQRPFTV